MTHPPGWTADKPCPSCGSWDITEYEFRIDAREKRMGWECRDCRHLRAVRAKMRRVAQPALTRDAAARPGV